MRNVLLLIKKHGIAISAYLLYLACWISQRHISQYFKLPGADAHYGDKAAVSENSLYYWLFFLALGAGAAITTTLLAVIHPRQRIFYLALGLCFIIPIVLSVSALL